MNFKKFISGISALSIAASAFAAMTITANAASVAFTEDFEGATYTEWTGINTGRYTQAISTGASATSASAENKYLQISAVGNGSNGSNQMLNASTAVPNGTSDFVMEFDARITNGSGQASHFYVASNSSSYGNYVYSNYVLKFGATAGGADTTTYIVNDNNTDTVTISKNVWNHYRVEVVDGHEYLTITGSDQTPRYEVKTLGTIDKGCKGLAYCTQRYYSAFAVDNVTLKTLSMPTLALNSNAATIATGASTTVNGTVTKGTETDSVVTTASSDNAAVTATVTGGDTTSPVINITSTGNEATTAKITVTTATNGAAADAAEVTTQTIDVVVGAVQYADVTVNYVDGSGNVLKTADTVSDQTVGLTYNATAEQMAAIDPVVLDGIYYYCSLNASSPTSVAVADGGSVLNLVFDKTEYTYDGTVTTNPNTTVSITGTSTSGTAISVAPVSNYAGVATAKLPAGTYTVNVSKTDYTSDSGELGIANGGANSASVVLSPVSGVVYSQTFDGNHTNLITGFATGGGQRYQGGKYQMYNGTGTASFGAVAEYDKYTVTIPGIALTCLSNYKNRSCSLSLMNGNDTVVVLTGTLGDEAGQFSATTLSAGETVYNNVGVSGDMTIVLDTTKASDNLKVTYNGNDYTFTTAADSISGLRFSDPNGMYIALSSIKVTGEIIPSALFTAHNWIATEGSGYTANGNVLTNSYGKNMYAYKAELTCNGLTYTTIKGNLTATDNTTGTPEWTQTLSGNGSFTIYLITNKTLNLEDSVVYCE